MLKHIIEDENKYELVAAAFGRLCVETVLS